MNVERKGAGTLPAPEVLWAELAPGSHVVQFCDHEQTLMETLEAFAAGGLLLGESVVVIATEGHLGALRHRLRERGMDVAHLQIFSQLIPVDASELLRRVMRRGRFQGWLFDAVVSDLLERARADGRRVRVFGEAVQLLWERGQTAAALELERHWQHVCDAEGIALLCAYHKDGFEDRRTLHGLREVCAAHGAVIT